MDVPPSPNDHSNETDGAVDELVVVVVDVRALPWGGADELVVVVVVVPDTLLLLGGAPARPPTVLAIRNSELYSACGYLLVTVPPDVVCETGGEMNPDVIVFVEVDPPLGGVVVVVVVLVVDGAFTPSVAFILASPVPALLIAAAALPMLPETSDASALIFEATEDTLLRYPDRFPRLPLSVLINPVMAPSAEE